MWDSLASPGYLLPPLLNFLGCKMFVLKAGRKVVVLEKPFQGLGRSYGLVFLS